MVSLMPRANRLFPLLEALRRRRRPVTGAALADELHVSLRTLYRDIAALRAQGAPIDGEAGVGFVLRPGYILPPIMFSAEEVEAITLGARFVITSGDDALARAARTALGKIIAVSPPKAATIAEELGLYADPHGSAGATDAVGAIRRAIRDGVWLRFDYQRLGATTASPRHIKPVALGYFEKAHVVAGWCEKRKHFRHFRVDRMSKVEPLAERYSPSRRTLLAKWKEQEAIPDQS